MRTNFTEDTSIDADIMKNEKQAFRRKDNIINKKLPFLFEGQLS